MQTMNKTVFPLVMAVLTACPVLFSCTEKEQEVPVENKIYEYRFELAGDDTRAYLNDEGVFWELNDHVGLFTPTESLEAAVNTDASPKTIDVQSSTSLAVGTKVYAYYPYVEGNTSVSASKVLFPAEQSGGSISAMPLAGIPAEVVTEGEYNGVIRFLNLGSVIDFRVFSSTHNNETVESITLEATEGHVAGTAAIDLTGVSWNATDETADIPELTWADGEGASTVTLTQSAPVAANKDEAIADGNLYMVIAPGTYSGAITVTTDAARYTFPFVEKTFALNGLKRFNLNLDKVERVDRFVTINLEKATELVAGEKYVLVSNGFALVRDGSAVSAAAFDATAMTIAVPTDLQSNVEWTLGTNTDSNNRGNVYDFSNGGYFFGILMNTAQTSYTYSVALNTSKQVATNQTMQNHNVNVETGYVYYRGNKSSQYIYYDTEAQAWTNHAASNGTFDPAYGTKLYKLKDMRAEQQLAYSVDAATYDLGTNTWTPSKPTLSGAQGDVTYNSSDEGVATVSVTGEVTPLKKGTTRITASADGNADYKPGTAFYDLTVINSQTVLVTYYKATQFDSGYQYMIVSGGMALKNAGNGEIVEAESVTVENDQITREEDPALLWTAADAPELDNYYYGTHTLTSGTEHLWRHSNNGNYTVEGSNASVTKYMIWSYEAEKLWNISVYNGNSSTYYTYYDNGWKSVSSSSAPKVKTNIFTARPPQTLNFSSTTAEYDLHIGGEFIEPVLSGHQTTVTYSPSDPSIATVNPSTGAVTPVAVGTVVITATAAPSAQYQGATATYTLTVTDSTPVEQVLSFDPEEVSFNIFGKTLPAPLTEKPTLSGYHTAVTYSSDNTAVATVDSNGNVTIASTATVGATATITATAAAGIVDNVNYATGTATYTITIESIQPSVYTKVSSVDDLDVGAKYVIVYQSGSKVFKPYLNGANFDKNKANAIEVNVDDDTITSSELDDCQMTLESGYYLYVDAAQRYFYPTSNSTLAAELTKVHALNIAIDNSGIAKIKSDNHYIYYSTNNSWFSTTSSNSANTALYKLDDGQPKARNLRFSEQSKSVNIYGKTESYVLTDAPTLLGKGLNDVTYSISGDDGVASINSTNGEVTLLLGTGTVTVTASAPATDQYKAGSAFYTLEVTNVAPPTYTKVTSITSGGTYLIVSHKDKLAFKGDGTTNGSSTSVTPDNGIITASSSNEFEEYEVIIKEESSGQYSIFFIKLNKYLYYQSSNSGLAYGETHSQNNDFTLDTVQTGDYSGSFLFTKSSKYLYHNGTQFKIGGSGSTYGVHLYKKN